MRNKTSRDLYHRFFSVTDLNEISCYAKKISSSERTISVYVKKYAQLFSTLFFIRSSRYVQSRVLWQKKEERVKKFRVHRIVLYITSLLSVSTQSNRAAVVGNCSSLLPGAPRVQSRIHEFLVRTPPLRSFFTYVSTSASVLSFPSRRVARFPVPSVCTVCARRIYLASSARRTVKKSRDVNRDTRLSKMQSIWAFMPFRLLPFLSPLGESLFALLIDATSQNRTRVSPSWLK